MSRSVGLPGRRSRDRRHPAASAGPDLNPRRARRSARRRRAAADRPPGRPPGSARSPYGGGAGIAGIDLQKPPRHGQLLPAARTWPRRVGRPSTAPGVQAATSLPAAGRGRSYDGTPAGPATPIGAEIPRHSRSRSKRRHTPMAIGQEISPQPAAYAVTPLTASAARPGASRSCQNHRETFGKGRAVQHEPGRGCSRPQPATA